MRPEVTALLNRYAETLAAIAMVLLGIWFALKPGPVLAGFGVALGVLGVGWLIVAVRRARFRTDGDAPGVVEVDEGRVTYMGPAVGASISLDEIAAVDVLLIAGQRRCWRLRTRDGQAILIPQAATGAENLHAAFATLPGYSDAAFHNALSYMGDAAHTVWRRSSVRRVAD